MFAFHRVKSSSALGIKDKLAILTENQKAVVPIHTKEAQDWYRFPMLH